MRVRAPLFLAAMILIWWCSWIGYERSFFSHIALVSKHLINFLLLTAVAIFGYLGLAKYRKWVSNIWVLIHSFVAVLLVFTGILDLLIGVESKNLRYLFGHIRILFTSPLPFAVLLFIAHSTDKAAKPSSDSTLSSNN